MILNGKDCCLIGVVIPVNWDSCRWVNGTQIEILYLAFMMFQYWWCFVFPLTASPAPGSAKQNYFVLPFWSFQTLLKVTITLSGLETQEDCFKVQQYWICVFIWISPGFRKDHTQPLAWPRRSFLITLQASWRCHKDIWKLLVATSTAEQHVLIRKVSALDYENKYFTIKKPLIYILSSIWRKWKTYSVMAHCSRV